MDDEPGKVIDGTARARHWRSSRSRSRGRGHAASPGQRRRRASPPRYSSRHTARGGAAVRPRRSDRQAANAALVAERDSSHAGARRWPLDAEIARICSSRLTRRSSRRTNRSPCGVTAALRADPRDCCSRSNGLRHPAAAATVTVHDPGAAALAGRAIRLIAVAAGTVIDRAAGTLHPFRDRHSAVASLELRRPKATLLSASGDSVPRYPPTSGR